MAIKVFTDQSLLITENRKHIFFFFLELVFTHKPWIQDYFNLVNSIKEADVTAFPLDICYAKAKYGDKVIKNFVNLVLLYHLPVWLYSGGDIGWSQFNAYPNIVHFRLAGFKSGYTTTTEILPAFVQDPLQDDEFKPIKTTKLPYSMGFVGHADGSLTKWIKELFNFAKREMKRWQHNNTDYQAFYPSAVKRFIFLNQLSKIHQLQTDFILRQKYRAGISNKIDQKKNTEEEFKNNIQNNLFTFCMRGGGNFSVRFYETLASGRIPFYLDTDTQLPLKDDIDWDKHIFTFTPQDSLHVIQEKFKNFVKHNDLEQMQINNRLLWQNRLSREAYTKQLFFKYRIK